MAGRRLTSTLGECLARSLDWALWLLVGLAAAAILLAFAPGVFNRELIAVTGGSMETTFGAGDALLARPLDDPSSEVVPGDVVIVQVGDGGTIQAHRVLLVLTDKAGDTYFKTGGDANAEADPGWASSRNVSAVVVATLPGLGGLLLSISQPLARLLLFVAPLVYIGLKELYAGLYAEAGPEAE